MATKDAPTVITGEPYSPTIQYERKIEKMPTETRIVKKILGIAKCPFCYKWNCWKRKCDHNDGRTYNPGNYLVFRRWYAPKVSQSYKGAGKPGGK